MSEAGKREIHTKYLDDLERTWKRKDNAKVNLKRKEVWRTTLIKLVQSKNPVACFCHRSCMEKVNFLISWVTVDC